MQFTRREEALQMLAMLDIAACHLREGRHPMALVVVEELIDCVNAGLDLYPTLPTAPINTPSIDAKPDEPPSCE
ncbi:MAG TPA: hypothetical protein VGI20_09340 [Rhizomicrobium sp.]|jgi:hypothetical protein